jgi:hypothetical protein
MFGQKSREREMYISEHVAYIRHRPTSSWMQYIYKLSRSSLHFFFFFFSTQRQRTYKTIRKGSIVGPTCSVVHLHRCSSRLLSSPTAKKFVVLYFIFVDYFLIYIKKNIQQENKSNQFY